MSTCVQSFLYTLPLVLISVLSYQFYLKLTKNNLVEDAEAEVLEVEEEAEESEEIHIHMVVRPKKRVSLGTLIAAKDALQTFLVNLREDCVEMEYAANCTMSPVTGKPYSNVRSDSFAYAIRTLKKQGKIKVSDGIIDISGLKQHYESLVVDTHVAMPNEIIGYRYPATQQHRMGISRAEWEETVQSSGNDVSNNDVVGDGGVGPINGSVVRRRLFNFSDSDSSDDECFI